MLVEYMQWFVQFYKEINYKLNTILNVVSVQGDDEKEKSNSKKAEEPTDVHLNPLKVDVHASNINRILT